MTAANELLRATMAADGSYRLTATATGWVLQGKLAAPVRELHASRGVDLIGRYQQLSAVWDGGARTAEIRVYESKPLSLFRDVWTHAGPKQSPFPCFASLPADTYRLSFEKTAFGHYEFGKLGPQGPWTFFDHDNHALILSPADNFLVSAMDAAADGSEQQDRGRNQLASRRLRARYAHRRAAGSTRSSPIGVCTHGTGWQAAAGQRCRRDAGEARLLDR